MQGYTFSIENSSIIDLKKEESQQDYSQRFNAGINLMYKISEKLNFSLASTYSGNISTLIKKDHYYVQQRNLFGLKIGILYFL